MSFVSVFVYVSEVVYMSFIYELYYDIKFYRTIYIYMIRILRMYHVCKCIDNEQRCKTIAYASTSVADNLL